MAMRKSSKCFIALGLLAQIIPLHSVSAQENHFESPKTKAVQVLQEGLSYTTAVYGKAENNPGYMVDVDFMDTKAEADQLAAALKGKGYKTTIKTVEDRAKDDPQYGAPLGYLVRTGPFAKDTDAKKEQKKLLAEGMSEAKVVTILEDGEEASGPWAVNYLEIDPDEFDGRLVPALSSDVIPGKEKLTDTMAAHDAIAGINGGYFVMGPVDGTEGDLAGVSVIDGKLNSEAVDGRTSLIFQGDRDISIAQVSTRVMVKGSKGEDMKLDGINRVPGLIRGCGGTGDLETDLPKHDFTCTDDDELIKYTSAFGSMGPQGEGFEVALNSKGKVIETRSYRGGVIPFAGSVVAGTGSSATWLEKNTKLGKKLKVREMVLADHRPMHVGKRTGVINGGPRLLKDGRVEITGATEGFHHPDNAEFYYRFGERRHARTIAGIKENGNLLFVTVDGKKPGYSIGLTFEEEAALMRSLGAKDAVNLDGGGSTTMAVNGQLVSRPSDAAGERPIGDAMLILPEEE